MKLGLLLHLILVAAAAAEPAVFGVGVTNITDTGAKLIFTTSALVRTTVTVFDGNRILSKTDEDAPSEIHRIDLTGLQASKSYRVTITAGGQPTETRVTAGLRAPKYDQFDNRTYLGVGHADNFDLVKELGAGMVRISPVWAGVQPTKEVIDEPYIASQVEFARKLKEAGVEPLVLLCYSNPWAKTWTDRQMTWRNPTFGPPDQLEDWANYVRQVMQRLKPYARYYETFNEPDAGYLATGKPAEATDKPDTVTNNPIYKGNIDYWLGDRYTPMAMAVRTVADEVMPQASVIGPSWNRDYGGSRGEVVFGRGLNRYLQQYSFHNYVGAPHSFEKWEQATDGRYMNTSGKLLTKYAAAMPTAVTEWGIQSYDAPDAKAGFATRSDAQAFLAKSVFYYLSQERVSILILHQLEGDDAWSLVQHNPDGTIKKLPTFGTYQWLCRTFNRKEYHRLSAKPDGGESIRAYAFSLPEESAVYVALWQNHGVTDKGLIPTPAKQIQLQISGIDGGPWMRQALDLAGKVVSQDRVKELTWSVTVPEADDKAESQPLIWRLVRQAKP